MTRRFSLTAATLIILAGCASTPRPPATTPEAAAPPQAAAAAPSLKQRGIASWYGPRFHGRTTANGERFNMHALTAAHPTLPLPSYVRVRNVANGREVIVRVNDRGPFHRGRIIDLSYAAARQLGLLLRPGTVEIERVPSPD